MNENTEQWNISKNAVHSDQGVVASQNWIASSVGADSLAKGGNAIDAAVSCAFALNIVEPWMCGLGGSGYIVIWLAKEKTVKVIDFQGTLPKNILFEDYPIDPQIPETIMGFPGVKNFGNELGYRSITIPGAVSGLSAAIEKFGKLGIDSILSKTIEIAERGLPVDWYTTLQIAIEAEDLIKFKTSSNIYLPNGSPPKPEQFIKLGNLSNTLKKLSEKGAREFYQGETAEKIISDLKKGGSRITLEDFSSYKPLFLEPLVTTHRGKQLYTAGENSGGKRLNEAFKYVEDNLDTSIPFGAHSYLTYAKALNKAFISHRERLQKTPNHGCTSHMSAVDSEGNMVALTYTLLNRFGSKVVLPKTGILMNNSVSYFDPRPGFPTSIEGGKRINSSNMCPTICIKDNNAQFAVGASGANHIVPCTMQISAFLLDYDFTLEKAFNLPRIDVNESDTITVDPDLGKETISNLGKHFKLEYAQNLVFPKLYSCPSGVLRDTNGINYGISDKLSPVAGAAIDGIFNLEKLSPQEIKKSRA